MASPTTGPYGSSSVIIAATGVDASPPAGITTDFTGAGHDPIRRLTNQIRSGAVAGGQGYFSTLGSSIGPDCELWHQVIADGANGNFSDFVMRLTSPNSSQSFYEIEVDWLTANPQNAGVFQMKAGTPTQIGSGTISINNGDFLAGACWGAPNPVCQLFLWDDPNNRWLPKMSVVDPNSSAALRGQGFLGIEGAGSSPLAFGDILGGTITVTGGVSITDWSTFPKEYWINA